MILTFHQNSTYLSHEPSHGCKSHCQFMRYYDDGNKVCKNIISICVSWWLRIILWFNCHVSISKIYLICCFCLIIIMGLIADKRALSEGFPTGDVLDIIPWCYSENFVAYTVGTHFLVMELQIVVSFH